MTDEEFIGLLRPNKLPPHEEVWPGEARLPCDQETVTIIAPPEVVAMVRAVRERG